MGVVYRATQLALDRIVALKLIAPELASDDGFRARFERESRAAASIEHPNILPVHDAGEVDGELYISMRFVDGEDLRRRVRATGGLGGGRAAAIIAQVAAGLDAAHARGLVHRDVKPANVLLDEGDHAYLTDFGLTKRSGDRSDGLSRAGGFAGTLGFVAPEQIRGERLDARADVYALGCVLYHALSGQSPYPRERDEAMLHAHLHEPPPALAPDGLDAFDAVIARAMAKDPADRYPSAGDLGAAALAAATGAPANAARPERSVATGEAAPGDVVNAPTVAPGADAPTRVAGPEAETAQRDDPNGDFRAYSAQKSPLAARVGRPVVVAAALVVAAAAVVFSLLARGGEDGGATVAADPARRDAHVTLRRDVGARPNSLTVAAGTVWVTGARSGTLVRLRAADGARLKGIAVPIRATDVAASRNSLWLTNLSQRTVTRFDLRTGRMKGAPIVVPGSPVAVAVDGDAVWIGSRGGSAGRGTVQTLLRIDARSGRLVGSPVAIRGGVQDVAAGMDAVWITNRFANRLVRIDQHTGAASYAQLTGRAPKGVAVGAGAVWVADSASNTVDRVDPLTLKASATAVGSDPEGIAASAHAVWVANFADDTVQRLDPRTGKRLGAPVAVGRNPKSLHLTGRSLWLTAIGDNRVERVAF